VASREVYPSCQPPVQAVRREGFLDLSRSVARSLRTQVSTRDKLRGEKTRASYAKASICSSVKVPGTIVTGMA
jgi:hypothetical protein